MYSRKIIDGEEKRLSSPENASIVFLILYTVYNLINHIGQKLFQHSDHIIFPFLWIF